jgi:hypothetical protein
MCWKKPTEYCVGLHWTGLDWNGLDSRKLAVSLFPPKLPSVQGINGSNQIFPVVEEKCPFHKRFKH